MTIQFYNEYPNARSHKLSHTIFVVYVEASETLRFVMFVLADCILFLFKLKWPKYKRARDLGYVYDVIT